MEFVFEPQTEGGYHVYAPELPGLHTDRLGLGPGTRQPRRLKHLKLSVSLVVPLQRELKRGTLAGILRDAGVDRDELRRLL